ncbi:hypothetical protein I79_017725 [Cricetulus griseus]|uniref:Uncharacterized protein n=1 Tax=Cricetulus griseus TaxID=10029 RepID=G3I2T1_CRIGR|nr:hypothetical protein I79_017725 [Cricetulus griseus]
MCSLGPRSLFPMCTSAVLSLSNTDSHKLHQNRPDSTHSQLSQFRPHCHLVPVL